MSLCDRCYSPGHCCRRFTPNEGGFEKVHKVSEGEQAVVEWLAKHHLPFDPLKIRDTSDSAVGKVAAWYYRCPHLGPEGRCGIYESRPDLCRSFEPQSDELCIHYHGTEAGDPTLPFPEAA